ncbi:hypothetical protein [Paraburkholderia caledonica]|uniref:Transmembrane protein n=1 Tax=Paraburkholderia caledonica TaxID=134536 RepID=A0AB73INU7_9BURK|nr:hypothetical protein [Paraburkholderia caledonica]
MTVIEDVAMQPANYLYKQNTRRRYFRAYFWSCLALVLSCALFGATLLDSRPLWKSTDDRPDNPTGFEVLAVCVMGAYCAIGAVTFLRRCMWVSTDAFYLPPVQPAHDPVTLFAGPAAGLRFEHLSPQRYGEFHLDILPYEIALAGTFRTGTGLRLYFNDSTCLVSSVNGSDDNERAFLHAFVARAAILRPDLSMSPQLAAYLQAETATPV